MLHGRRSLPKDNIVSFSRYKRNDTLAGMPNAEPSDVEYLNKELDYLKFRLSLGSGVCFPFITDIHPGILPSSSQNYGWNAIYKNFSIYKKESTKKGGRYVYNSGEKMDVLERATAVLLRLSETNRMDCCVLGGDYGGTNGDSALSKEQFLKILGGQSEIMGKISRRMPVLVCKGNHDSNAFNKNPDTGEGRSQNMVSLNAYSNGDAEIFPTPEFSEDEYKKHCINGFLSFSSDVIYGDANKTYGYYDIVDKKVRILFLNIYDYTFTTTFDASNRDTWFIGEQQLKFIANSALQFDENQTGWNVILCCHTAIFHTASGGISNDYRNNVFKMFICFQHGMSGSFPTTVHSANDDNLKITSFNYDFTNNIRSGNILNKIFCGFCGHNHKTAVLSGAYSISNGVISMGSGTNVISFIEVDAISQPTANGQVSNSDSSDYRVYIPSGQNGNRGYVHKAIFDIIQFNPTNNEVYCHRYGFGESRHFTRSNNGTLTLSSKTVTITVIDKTSKSVIQGASVNIILNGGTITKTTNGSGQAEFGFMPIDKFDIKITAEGYEDYTNPDTISINITSKQIELTRNE